MTPTPAESAAFVAALPADWFQPKNVLITGATGFFGTWLLESFTAANQAHGLKVALLAQSRQPEAFLRREPRWAKEAGIHWIAREPHALTAADIPHDPLDAVIHLVTEADNAVILARPDEARRSIVESTRAALALAAACGARDFLFTSSGSVYQPSLTPHRENDALVERAGATTARALGGSFKRQAEELCEQAAARGQLSVKIARCFSFAGPGMPTTGKFALGNFIHDAVLNRDIRLLSDGQARRSYLYASDLVVWLLTILTKGESGRVYNVGSAQPVSLLELAERVRKIVAPRVGLHVSNESRGVDDCYLPDTSRARTELGLQETVPLDDAIKRTATWLRGRLRVDGERG